MAKQLNRKAIAAHDPTTQRPAPELPKSDPFRRFDQTSSTTLDKSDIDIPTQTDIDITSDPAAERIRPGRTTREPLSKTVLVAFRPHEHALIQQKAAEQGLSVRQYMRQAILRAAEM